MVSPGPASGANSFRTAIKDRRDYVEKQLALADAAFRAGRPTEGLMIRSELVEQFGKYTDLVDVFQTFATVRDPNNKEATPAPAAGSATEEPEAPPTKPAADTTESKPEQDAKGENGKKGENDARTKRITRARTTLRARKTSRARTTPRTRRTRRGESDDTEGEPESAALAGGTTAGGISDDLSVVPCGWHGVCVCV